jgi:endonuclease III
MSPDGRRIRAIHRRLLKHFGRLDPPRRSDPLAELILTVLSQNTSDVNSARAYESLRSRYPTWESLSAARPSDVAAAIRSGGLSNVKAPRILAILHELQEREGRFDLRFLRSMSDQEALDYLTSLPGVGPKSAAVVMAFSLDRPTLPVDTHVHRVAGRLGLVPSKTSPAMAQRMLEAMTPPDLRVSMHVGLIRLGREVCKAGRPRCEVCPLAELCPTAPLILGTARPRRRRREPGDGAGEGNRTPVSSLGSSRSAIEPRPQGRPEGRRDRPV